MDHLDRLAAFAAGTQAGDIPEAALARTRLILIDSLGAILGGMAEPEMRALAARARMGDPGPARLLGTGRRGGAAQAAFLGGTAGTALEMDEGSQFARGHPGMHSVPAALAAAGPETEAADLLSALTLAYEVGARVGIASDLRASTHPHGTWGTIAAAVAVARLMSADAGAMRTAIGMAATLGLATSRRTMLEGATVRNSFTGFACQTGVLIGDMLAAGFSAGHDDVAHVFGQVISERYDPAALTQDLGHRWEVSRNYFKLHACCRFNHAALDALDRLDPRPRAEDVARIEVETYALAVELSDPAPETTLGARFSLPFAMATALVTGQTGVESFAPHRLQDPAIRALAARVSLYEDPAMTACLPDQRPARVRVHLHDGRVLEAATETNRGDWSDPYTERDLRAKYDSLARRLWAPGDADAVWHAAMALGSGSAAPLFGAIDRAEAGLAARNTQS